jgi:hypothetical protein
MVLFQFSYSQMKNDSPVFEIGPLLSQIELQKITAWSVPKRQKLPTVARAQ